VRVQAAQLKAVVRTLGVQSPKIIFAGQKAYAVGDTITICLNLPTDVFNCGHFAVDAQKFKEVTGRFDGDVAVEVTENLIKLKHKRSRIELPVEKDVVIPKIAGIEGGQTFNTKDLMAMLGFVSQVSVKSDQYSYAGVLSLMSRSGLLTAVATDGKRVAICTGCPSEASNTYLIDLGVLNALKTIVAQRMAISEDEGNVYFQSGDVLLASRKLARQFPNWESIIPTSFSLKIAVKGADMKQALGDVKPVIDPDSQKLSLTIGEEMCMLTVEGGLGKAETSCPATSIESDLFDLDHKLTVNHSFLADFFDQCDGDVIIGVNSATQPLYLESNNGSRRLVCLTQKP
jgi:DNA polymerase III sliding clamp (beta) subunit (PCNA family)